MRVYKSFSDIDPTAINPIAKSPEVKPMIFVFGSNLAGVHAAGAALTARRLHGAELYKGVGIQGNSYAIPTKDWDVSTSLPLPMVADHVRTFLIYAIANSHLGFQITRIGCGLAGFRDEEIAPLFTTADPKNCFFDLKWREHLPKGFEYWGTY